jgi:hypothetical protein
LGNIVAADAGAAPNGVPAAGAANAPGNTQWTGNVCDNDTAALDWPPCAASSSRCLFAHMLH